MQDPRWLAEEYAKFCLRLALVCVGAQKETLLALFFSFAVLLQAKKMTHWRRAVAGASEAGGG